MAITVRSLHLYPVKACRGIDVDRLTVGPTGPVGDRVWQVVDGDATPMTQRTVPALATIAVEPIDGGLRLAAEGNGSIEVATPTTATTEVAAKVAAGVSVGDAGDEAAAWLARVVDRPARLVALVDASDIRFPVSIDPWGHGVSFVDAAPIVVANQASADWLAERASEPFGMDRFRANVVVDGAEPWAEDTWQRFTVGPAELRGELPWPRCAVPQVDQVTGERMGEPAKVLRAHRWCSEAPTVAEAFRGAIEGNALFAIGCDIGPVGVELAVGDEVTIAATGDPVLAPPAA